MGNYSGSVMDAAPKNERAYTHLEALVMAHT